MFANISPSQWLGLCLLIIPLLIQWIYFYGYFYTLFAKTKTTETGLTEGVSIIVCAKNELNNLKELIPILCSQNYPKYEVIIVNDGSWDDSHLLINGFKEQYSYLKSIYLDPEKKLFSGKKLGITLGIKSSIYDNILLTDADCRPQSNEWISLMTNALNTENELVLGYSPYKKLAGLLNLFIRFETQLTAILYLSKAIRGKAYMGVGRNLAYTKASFYAVKGFGSHHHIYAGDDDLHIQRIAKNNNTAVVIDKAAFVETIPKQTWHDWVNQKRRHLQIGGYYKPYAKRFSGLFIFSHFWFSLSFLALILFHFSLWPILLIILGTRYIINGVSYAICARKLNDLSTVVYYPVLDFLMQCYWLSFGVYVFLTKNKEW